MLPDLNAEETRKPGNEHLTYISTLFKKLLFNFDRIFFIKPALEYGRSFIFVHCIRLYCSIQSWSKQTPQVDKTSHQLDNLHAYYVRTQAMITLSERIACYAFQNQESVSALCSLKRNNVFMQILQSSVLSFRFKWFVYCIKLQECYLHSCSSP